MPRKSQPQTAEAEAEPSADTGEGKGPPSKPGDASKGARDYSTVTLPNGTIREDY